MGNVTKLLSVLMLAALLALAACGGKGHNDARTSGLTSASIASTKETSQVSADVRLAARDAGIALSGGGYTLTWKYANSGDYNQDGAIGFEDTAPLAEHWNEAVSASNDWIDGSGDGVIGVADITPIAMN